MMITFLLLLSLLCQSKQHGGGVLHCGPQNLTLNTSGQMILLTWEDKPSCSAVHDVLIYKLEVYIADKLEHNDEVAVATDQIGATHSWNWTSYLALECASHSVWLRSQYKNHTSDWKQAKTPGEEIPKEPNIFPKDRHFKVGSRVTFCCVLPEKQVFNNMRVTGYSSAHTNTSKISNRTYSLTVDLNQASRSSCTNVKCETNSTIVHESGACAYIGNPPDVSNLQCETRDLKSVECHWTVREDPEFPIVRPTDYLLLGRCPKHSNGSCSQTVRVVRKRNETLAALNTFGKMELSDTADLTDISDLQCESRDVVSGKCHWTVGGDTDLPIRSPTNHQLLGSPCPNGRCSQTVQVVGERNWILTARNAFGTVELSDTADLTKRVHMDPPTDVKASTVNARNVSLEWEWPVLQYNNLNITCQVNISHGGETIIEIFGVGLKFALLNDLIPNWTYDVTIRCRTAQDFWKWSNWSTTVNLHTRGDVPDALDVWMQTKDNQTITIWKKPLANQSHGQIQDYEVTWTKTTERGQQNLTKEVTNNHSLALSLEATQEYLVTVTARNINGSSPPSTITISSLNPDSPRVNTSRITGSLGSFNLSWSPSPTASCGYVVDWCPTVGPCVVEWLKVPPNETKATVSSENFKDGLRYTLSIYSCTQGAPVLLERREGYVSEKRMPDQLFQSLKGKQQNSDFVVSWEALALREQTAFIQGYVLSCVDSNNIVFNFSTDDPEATTLTARNLKIGAYTFIVNAKTAVGECGRTFIRATMNSLTDNMIKSVFISLVSVFVLLSLITILCYRRWTCIKHKVYPPIPKPVLTSVGHHKCHPLQVDQYEADIVDVAELFNSAGAPMNGYSSQKNVPFITQTANTYYKNLSNIGIPSLSVLAAPAFKREFPNPTYDLITPTQDQQSCPELQVRTFLEQCSSGYQTQIYPEAFSINQTEDPESCKSGSSAYIVVPH